MATERQKAFFEDVKQEHRQAVVGAVLARIREGDLDWSKSWDVGLLRPQNPVTGTKYRGINRLWLAHLAMSEGFDDPRWVTFNHARKAGWKVKKGSHGTYVEYWSPTRFRRQATAEEQEAIDDGSLDAGELTCQRWVLKRVDKVFNACQVEGLPEYEPAQISESEVFEMADRYIGLAQCTVTESLASEGAYYSVREDEVVVPGRATFGSPEAFAATLWHELAHSTGHPSRMGRDLGGTFGSQRYAEEELRAELASVLVQSEMGLSTLTDGTEKASGEFESSCAYLASWAERASEEDVAATIVAAAGAASAICDMLTRPYYESMGKEVAR